MPNNQSPEVPGSDTDPDSVSVLGGTERYELLDEIAHGGMGVVFRAQDRAFDREVGLKTLLKVPSEGSVIAARFREEARVTAQLQHPNIPPVHDQGTLPDGRPFLAMKLIKGRTLEALLKDRSDPSHDRGQFIAIFEKIAEGVAYAHAHKVIHRDLKPLNVMVGAFGEVQVMDWGLAKVLTGERIVPAATGQRTPAVLTSGDVETAAGTEIHPAETDLDGTQVGSVLGTPAYMPREQAIGAVDQIDTRSDVFSLGGILCTILTGEPPYVGGDAESTRQLAVIAKLDVCFARLDECGAEPDLIALCKRCLSAERDDRPRDAGEVAKAVAELRAEAEKRARQAELDRVRAEGERAKAETQAAEQRKRRKVQLALAVAVLLLVTGGVAFAWWRDMQASERKLADELAKSEQQRIEAEGKETAARLARERDSIEAAGKITSARLEGERDAEARNKAQQARDGVSANLVLATTLRKQYKLKAAAMALSQAAALAKGAPERLEEVEQAQRDLVFVVQLDDIRFRKWIWIAEQGGKGDYNTKIAAEEYPKAFAANGLDLTTLVPEEAAKRIAASAVKTDLVAAVDDWALYLPAKDAALRDRLLEIARRADKGDWTDRLRDSRIWTDKAALARLAAEADPATTSPASLSVLAELMRRRNDLDPSPLLTRARAAHPTSFELAFALGQWHMDSKDGQQIGPYEAARALRPENPAVWINLGNALKAKGDRDGAIVAYKKASELDPNDAYAHNNLGVALHDKNDVEGASVAYKKAIELDPKDAKAHFNLGNALKDKRDVEGAIVAYKKAIELDPKYTKAHNNLGVALHDKGDVEGAIVAYKKAIELDPNDAKAHFNFGVALYDKGDVEGAIVAYKKAIELDPNDAKAHFNFGIALHVKGDVEGAIASFKKAIELDPQLAPAHFSLGVALNAKGELEGASVAYKKAIELAPKYAQAHFNLGVIYLGRKKYAEAIECARAASKADPKYSNAHALLGLALQETGDIPGARAALTEAARLDKRWAGLLAKLPPIPAAPAPREVKRP